MVATTGEKLKKDKKLSGRYLFFQGYPVSRVSFLTGLTSARLNVCTSIVNKIFRNVEKLIGLYNICHSFIKANYSK